MFFVLLRNIQSFLNICLSEQHITMVGRKAAVPPSEVISAILKFKDRIVIGNEGANRKYLFVFQYFH